MKMTRLRVCQEVDQRLSHLKARTGLTPNLILSAYGSWDALAGWKRFAHGPLRIPMPGKLLSRNSCFLHFVGLCSNAVAQAI